MASKPQRSPSTRVLQSTFLPIGLTQRIHILLQKSWKIICWWVRFYLPYPPAKSKFMLPVRHLDAWLLSQISGVGLNWYKHEWQTSGRILGVYEGAYSCTEKTEWWYIWEIFVITKWVTAKKENQKERKKTISVYWREGDEDILVSFCSADVKEWLLVWKMIKAKKKRKPYGKYYFFSASNETI